MSWPGADWADNGLLLDRDRVFPDFDNPSRKAWPPYEVPLNVQIAESPIFRVMPQAPADRLRPRR